MKYIIIILLFTSYGRAADQWFCTESASKIQHSSVFTCGVGEGKNETEARRSSFDDAENEFKHVCDPSDNCKDHNVNVIPQRMSCIKLDGGYKCYRMVVYEILPEMRKPRDQQIKQENKKQVYIGQTKEEFFALFGKPNDVSNNIDIDGKSITYYYNGELCAHNMGYCYLRFRRGLLESYEDIKTSLLRDL